MSIATASAEQLIDDGGGPREDGGALRRPLNAPWMPSSSSHEFAECSVLGVTSSSLPPGDGEPAVAPVTMDEGWTVLRLGDLRGLSSPLALVRCLDGEGRGWRLLPEGDCDEEGGRDFSLALDSRRGSFGGGGEGEGKSRLGQTRLRCSGWGGRPPRSNLMLHSHCSSHSAHRRLRRRHHHHLQGEALQSRIPTAS